MRCYHRKRTLLPMETCFATIGNMSRTTVAAWKCDRPECGWVWIATSDVPPTACAKCKSRTWHRPSIEERRAEVQASVPGVQTAAILISGKSRHILPPAAPSEPIRPKLAPRCPLHRSELILRPESSLWTCRVPKCRFRADDDQVRIAFETADFASV